MSANSFASSSCERYEVEGLLKCQPGPPDNCRIILHEGSFSEKIILVKNSNSILYSLDSNFIRAKISMIKSKELQVVIEEAPLRLPAGESSMKKIGDEVCN